MSLQFITGNSGNGKTKYLFNRIVKEAKANPRDNYLVIVPEQFTMQTQRQLVDLWCELIRRQPTAYDVDKVVEQLEELRKECEDPLQDYDPNYFIDKAIEITKGGGVDGN